MPRYHFNLCDRVDERALDLTGLVAAKCEALELAARDISDKARSFWDREEWLLTVTDERGLFLLQLQIVGTQSAALPSSASRPPSDKNAWNAPLQMDSGP